MSRKSRNTELKIGRSAQNSELATSESTNYRTPPARGDKSKQLKGGGGGGRGVKGAGVSDTAVKTKKGGKGGKEKGAKDKGGKEKWEKEKAADGEKGEKEKSGSRGKTLTFINQNSH